MDKKAFAEQLCERLRVSLFCAKIRSSVLPPLTRLVVATVA
ncbi:MAG: hypothetical protein M0Z84_11970 [Gammaproteobacteria bacterium]|nr:hypothetical protein [Gammaproteobacteria bacterium]